MHVQLSFYWALRQQYAPIRVLSMADTMKLGNIMAIIPPNDIENRSDFE